jgi:hypothetical protein
MRGLGANNFDNSSGKGVLAKEQKEGSKVIISVYIDN